MRRPLVLLALPLLLLTGCSGAAAAKSTPTPTLRTVDGSISLGADAATTDGVSCTAADGYTDIATGAEVDVLDNGGKVLAIGSLQDGVVQDDGTCQFQFTVSGVPGGESIYGVKVGSQARGVVHFTRAQMFDGGPALTLG